MVISQMCRPYGGDGLGGGVRRGEEDRTTGDGWAGHERQAKKVAHLPGPCSSAIRVSSGGRSHPPGSGSPREDQGDGQALLLRLCYFLRPEFLPRLEPHSATPAPALTPTLLL